MISRRDKLLKYPWEQQRYEMHREKVRSAKPAIDVRSPEIYNHVITKAKKIQTEKERLSEIEKENIRLLQRLGDIMRTKRIENFWIEPRPNFLNRQKLFEVRPQTSLPKYVAVYASSYDAQQLKAPQAKTTKRCPTCSGKPEITEVCIPEKRVPWQTACSSWSYKTKTATNPKYCYHCGHLKLKSP